MSVYEAINQFLNDENVRFEHDEELNLIRFFFSAETAGWMVTVHHFEEASQLVVLSHFPSVVEEEFRTVVGEFVLRVNWELVVGGYDFGVDDGNLRFRTSIDIDDLEVTPLFVRNLIYSNISTMDLHIAALNRVAHGGSSVEEAFQLLGASLQE